MCDSAAAPAENPGTLVPTCPESGAYKIGNHSIQHGSVSVDA